MSWWPKFHVLLIALLLLGAWPASADQSFYSNTLVLPNMEGYQRFAGSGYPRWNSNISGTANADRYLLCHPGGALWVTVRRARFSSSSPKGKGSVFEGLLIQLSIHTNRKLTPADFKVSPWYGGEAALINMGELATNYVCKTILFAPASDSGRTGYSSRGTGYVYLVSVVTTKEAKDKCQNLSQLIFKKAVFKP